MIVVKFGGTSVSTKERILTIANIVRNDLNRQPVIVVSALSGMTDLLLSVSATSYSQAEKTVKKINVLHQNLIKDLFRDNSKREDMSNYLDDRINEIRRIAKKGNAASGTWLSRAWQRIIIIRRF